MEEVLSTEALDREILEDARKKADRILKDAEKEKAVLVAEGAARIAEAEAALRKRYEERLVEFERNLENSLPLEKNRKRMRHLDSVLTEALDSFLSSLDAETVEAALGRLLRGAKGAFAGRTVEAEYCGIDRSAAERLVGSAVDDGKIASLAPSAEGGYVGCLLRSVAAESAEGAARRAGRSEETRFRATVADVRAYLLERKRGDLAQALFPGEPI
jgi:V/A-type H+/Na+-transporting ATPase subunit E